MTSGEAYALLHGGVEEAAELRAELERVRKESKRRPSDGAAPPGQPDVVIRSRDDIGGDQVVVAEVKSLKGGELRDLSDRIRQQEKAAAVLVGSIDDGRAFLVFNLDQSLAGRGLDASALVREAATRIGGGGGGRPTLAEAGGKHPEKLAEALEAGKRAIVSALAG